MCAAIIRSSSVSSTWTATGDAALLLMALPGTGGRGPEDRGAVHGLTRSTGTLTVFVRNGYDGTMSAFTSLFGPVDGSEVASCGGYAASLQVRIAKTSGAALTFVHSVDLTGAIAQSSNPYGATDVTPIIQALSKTSPKRSSKMRASVRKRPASRRPRKSWPARRRRPSSMPFPRERATVSSSARTGAAESAGFSSGAPPRAFYAGPTCRFS